MSENEQATQQKPDWQGIIRDMLILVGVMGALGYLCNLAMKPFEVVTPTDNLVALIRKGGDITPFTKELKAGMEKHADFVNTPDGTGRTPLMWAVYTHTNDPAAAWREDARRVNYVETLMSTPGINLNAKDQDGFTAMHWAAWSGMPQCTFLLTQGGMDVDSQENNGYTPLMLAALRGNAAAVKLLLILGADPAKTNKDGKTALQLAEAKSAAYEKRGVHLFEGVLPDAVAERMPRPYGLIYVPRRCELYRECITALQNVPEKKTDLTIEQVKQHMDELIDRADSEDKAEEEAEGGEQQRESEQQAAEEAVQEATVAE